MTLTPEMQLLNYCDLHGHAESARILRGIVEKQRTPHSDTDAHPENLGPDLFAGGAGITPEQARFAYDSALEAPTQAVPCDSGASDAMTYREGWFRRDTYVNGDARTEEYFRAPPLVRETQLLSWSGWLVNEKGLFRRTLPKHTYILSDGTPRQEPCCR